MSNKKHTTKVSKSIARRAQAIINSTEGYDRDTREAIKNAVKYHYHDLPELVAAAEKGEVVLDVAGAALRCNRMAANVMAFLGKEIPDFIHEAILDALDEAGRRTKFAVPMFNEPKAKVRKLLADLFSQTDGSFSLRRKNDTYRELAEHIAAVYSNPCTPADVYNALADAVNDLADNYLSKVANTAPYIEQSLTYHAQAEAQEGVCS